MTACLATVTDDFTASCFEGPVGPRLTLSIINYSPSQMTSINMVFFSSQIFGLGPDVTYKTLRAKSVTNVTNFDDNDDEFVNLATVLLNEVEQDVNASSEMNAEYFEAID